MKRKIERYLGNGNDENIQYLEDGRFDFNGDMEGVLQAVREYEGRKSTSGKKNSRTPAKKYFTSNAYRNRNSASRILFEEKYGKTTVQLSSNQSDPMDYFVENIFASPDSNAVSGNVAIPSKPMSSERKPTATNGPTSILRTPQIKAPMRSPTLTNNSLIKTPAEGFDLKGYTPLSTNTAFAESEMLAYGLFSPNGPLGNDFVMEGIKTPNAFDNPRVCIANVRFGDSPAIPDQKQRNVAISPIKSAEEIFQKRKRQPLFSTSSKKRKNGKGDDFPFGLVTPSLSISSRNTVATVPLTVCSSASSARTNLSIEELGKVRLLQINSSVSNNAGAAKTPLDDTHPNNITQETPDEPIFSPSPTAKLGSILKSAKKTNVRTPADKFWSSLGGIGNFTPFRENEGGVGESSLMSPTSNSKFFQKLIEDDKDFL